MIKKLQHRFIAITGLSVVLMMALLLVPMNLYNTVRVGMQLQRTLNFLMEAGSADGQEAEQSTEQEQADSASGIVSLIRELLWSPESILVSPEGQYQLRYFVVEFDAEGAPASVDTSHMRTVDDAEAVEQAALYLRRFRSHGFVRQEESNFYFQRVRTEQGGTRIGFLDCTREANNLKTFRLSSVTFAFVITLVLLILISLLSRRAMQPYIDNLESQREFITNAGHELKTPLTIISANTEVLEMMNGKNEWTESILAQVKRGTSLINELVTLSRVTEAKQPVLTEVDFSVTAKDASDSFRPVIEQQGKHLNQDIQPDLKVKGEQRMLTELVNILVDNAAKYCDEGGTVTVVLQKKGRSGAQLLVSNDYKDGAEVDYSRFFRRFYRGDTSHNSKKAGYGIGLSMAQTITEKLKGSINARWKDGVITFTVSF